MSPTATPKKPKCARSNARQRAKAPTPKAASETPAAEAKPTDADLPPTSTTTATARPDAAEPKPRRAPRRKPSAQSHKASAAPQPHAKGKARAHATADRRAASQSDAQSDANAPTDPSPAIDSALSLALRRTSRADRVRHLIVLDAQSVVRRLNAQLSAMIELFSRHRDRDPLLAPLRSWLPGATFDALAELEPDEQRATAAFLEELEALRWYCRYTNDMPNTAQQRLTRFASQLETAAERLIRAIHPTIQP